MISIMKDNHVQIFLSYPFLIYLRSLYLNVIDDFILSMIFFTDDFNSLYAIINYSVR